MYYLIYTRYIYTYFVGRYLTLPTKRWFLLIPAKAVLYDMVIGPLN